MSVLSVLGAVLLVLLKGIGILLLVVLTLAVVLLFCPFCADVQWANDVLTIRAGALGLTPNCLYRYSVSSLNKLKWNSIRSWRKVSRLF